jgi:hypothetical protein
MNEIAGEPEAGIEVFCRYVHILRAEEGRQRQQPVAPRLPRPARDCAARLGRYVGEIGRAAGGGAGIEVEAEPELRQHHELEAHPSGATAPASSR